MSQREGACGGGGGGGGAEGGGHGDEATTPEGGLSESAEHGSVNVEHSLDQSRLFGGGIPLTCLLINQVTHGHVVC